MMVVLNVVGTIINVSVVAVWIAERKVKVQIGLELKVWGWSSRGSGRLCIHSSLTCIHQHQPLL